MFLYLLIVFPVLRRSRQGERKHKFISLKHGFRLHVQHKTAQPMNCDIVSKTVELSKPARALRSHRYTSGFPQASGLVPEYPRQSWHAAEYQGNQTLAAHLHTQRTTEEKHFVLCGAGNQEQ